VSALLRYAHEFVEGGREWPPLYEHDPAEYGWTWESGLCARMANAIGKLSAGATRQLRPE
jgi:hypothetical protein